MNIIKTYVSILFHLNFYKACFDWKASSGLVRMSFSLFCFVFNNYFYCRLAPLFLMRRWLSSVSLFNYMYHVPFPWLLSGFCCLWILVILLRSGFFFVFFSKSYYGQVSLCLWVLVILLRWLMWHPLHSSCSGSAGLWYISWYFYKIWGSWILLIFAALFSLFFFSGTPITYKLNGLYCLTSHLSYVPYFSPRLLSFFSSVDSTWCDFQFPGAFFCFN